MKKILIVEDESSISDLIKFSLKTSGYRCCQVFDGEKAADLLIENRYDLILLDIMLPKVDGFELMEFIRPMKIPVIFISAKGKTEDKVKGLKLGADDYISKPFEVVELLARVESVLRRYNKTEETLQYNDIQVDETSYTVTKDGQNIILTDKEFKLLVLLIKNKSLALFREQIYENVWEGEYTGDSRTIDLHIQRLRKKLDLKDKIVSIFKIGYRLED
ncbi:MAG: two component transcriptional regulator, winged helix family [Anaerocolumna sp.]|jgi:DNA-binding response OmpR family regulator|nr:two component transcriptional regulator, winged helix family [Anaerocolumna sp.]